MELRPKFLARASKVFVFRLFVWYEHRSCSLSGVEIEHRPGAGGLGGRKEKVEDTLFDIQLCLVGNFVDFLLARHLDGNLGQVANHALNIAADVADFSEL